MSTRLPRSDTSVASASAAWVISAEMTLRYAALASPTVRAAYEQAMTKVHARQALFVRPAGQGAAPDKVEWLRSEMLKTRVAHGYCSRDLVVEACPYAICEQCLLTEHPAA